MKVLAVAVAFLFFAGAAQAQEDRFSIEGFAERNARLMIVGMAFGFGTFGSELEGANRPALYCPPADVNVTGNYLWNLADSELDGDHDLETVARTVMTRLRALFPCP